MRIVVTGSSGTIGTHLCEALLQRGDEVIGIDWRENEWVPAVEALTVHVDLRDQAATLEAWEQQVVPKGPVDLIVHLAANARVYDLVEDPDRARDNVLSAYNMLECARRYDVPRFMFASSRETYGNIGSGQFTEDMVRVENCESPYTASKVAGEAFVHSYSECYGLGCIIFRFSNVYGMYDNSDRFVPLCIQRALKNEPLVVFGREKLLDFTYTGDNTAGLLLGIDKFDQAKGQTFNFGNGEGTRLIDAVESIRDILGSSSEVSVTDSRPGEVVQYVADISHAREVLGYNPQTPFAEGVRKAVDWYKNC